MASVRGFIGGFIIFAGVFFPGKLGAQFFLEQGLRLEYESFAARDTTNPNIPTALFPQNPGSDHPEFIRSCFRTGKVNLKTRKYGFFRKLLDESLIKVSDSAKGFSLSADPLFQFEWTNDQNKPDTSYFRNTRGYRIRGSGKKFGFESWFLENQSAFPDYIDSMVRVTGVVPGLGRWKKVKFKPYDFALAGGTFYFRACPNFEVSAGHGKFFVGNGYRSLFLSDNAFNYPFLKLQGSYKRFSHTLVQAVLMNLNSGGTKTPPFTERLFQKKPFQFQLLEYTIPGKISLGYFQGLIGAANDSMNHFRPGTSWFFPIPFVAPLINGFHGKENTVAGFNVYARVYKTLGIYGQWVVDGFPKGRVGGSLRNKQAWQAGINYLNVAGINNLHLRAEYNRARPYTYSHELPAQSWTHYNQALAHPLGGNFEEWYFSLSYRVHRFSVSLSLNMAHQGKDSLGNHFGSNPLQSDLNAFYGPESTINEMFQGRETNILNQRAMVSYLVNPAYNFVLFAGAGVRESGQAGVKQKTPLVFFGLKTALWNQYLDF